MDDFASDLSQTLEFVAGPRRASRAIGPGTSSRSSRSRTWSCGRGVVELLRVHLFGPGRVTNVDSELTSHLRPVQLRILTQLVAAGTLGCSTDALITNTWPEPPSTARVSLRNHIMRVRGLLGSDGAAILKSTPHGYVLDLDADGVDIWCFEAHLKEAARLLQAGDEVNAGGHFEQALQLWTGLPFAGCEELAEGQAALLQNEFLTATVALADQWIGRNDHAGASRLIRQARLLDPFDERLARLDLWAIAGLGSSTQRLTEAYTSFARQLDEEIGIQPQPATKAVYEELIAGRSSASQHSTPERHLVAVEALDAGIGTPAIEPVTGRVVAPPLIPESARLSGRDEALDAVSRFLQSPKTLMTATGARGSGKSSFAAAVAEIALAGEHTVTHGSLATGPMPDWVADSDSERRTLLVLDDLELASPGQVEAIVSGLRSAGTTHRTVVTYRRDWSGPAADTWMAYEDHVAMQRSLETIALTPLDLEATVGLGAKLLGDEADEIMLSHIHEECGGNPLIATELLESGFERGGKVPTPLIRLVQAEVRRLPAEQRKHFDHLAVLGPELDLSGLIDRSALGDAIEVGLNAGLLIEAEEQQTVRFAAPIFCRAIYEGLSRQRRHELHLGLAQQLRDHPGRRREAARHALGAEALMSSSEVYEIVRAGASTAAERGDSEESTRLYLAAVRLHRLVHPDDQESFTELVVDLYGCVDDSAAPEVLEAWQLAVDGARSRHDPALVLRLAESRLDRWIGQNTRFTDLLAEAISWCSESQSAIRTRLRSRLALEMSETAPWPTGYDLAREAETSARQLGEPSAICPALRALIANSYRDISPSERLRRANDLTNTARLQLDPDMQMIGMIYSVLELIALGRRSDPLRQLAEIESLAKQRKRPRYQSMVETIRIGLASAKDDEELVDEVMERLEALALATSNRDARLTVIGHSILQRWAVGEHAKSAPMLLAAFDSSPMEYFLLFLTATALVEDGDLAAAQRVIAEVDYEQLPSGIFYPACLALGAEVAVGLNDTEAAKTLTDLLTPLEGTTLIFSSGMALLGPAEGFLAELAMVLGDTDRARHLFEQAIYAAEQVGDDLVVQRLQRRRAQTFAGSTPGPAPEEA